MQKHLFPLRTSDRRFAPDGYSVHSWTPVPSKGSNVEVALCVLREMNAKHQWAVYTRHWDADRKVLEYEDGLEFRAEEHRAMAEYHRRITELRERMR